MGAVYAFLPLIVVFAVMYFVFVKKNRWNAKFHTSGSLLSSEERRKRSVMQDAVLIPVGILAYLASDRITAYFVVNFVTNGDRFSYDDAKTLNNVLFFGGLLLAAFASAKLIWFLLDTKDSEK